MRAHISLIAALFLATGEALAYPPNYYDCGYAFLKTLMSKGSAASGNRVFPMTWTIQDNWEKQDRKNLESLSRRALNFTCSKADDSGRHGSVKCWLNGKLCRPISDEKGREVFSDDED
jgi:hypothetical protein